MLVVEKKKLSIPAKEGFAKIFSNPDVSLSIGEFTLLGKRNLLNTPRIGISIKKKDYKLAHKRNLLKRQIRGSFYSRTETLPSMDFVVQVKNGLSKNKTHYKNDIISLWETLLRKNK